VAGFLADIPRTGYRDRRRISDGSTEIGVALVRGVEQLLASQRAAGGRTATPGHDQPAHRVPSPQFLAGQAARPFLSAVVSPY
jgi:hypothetical protein